MSLKEDFRPAPALKKLYFTYFAGIFLFAFAWWLVPLMFFVPFPMLFFGVPLLAVVVFVAYWIPKYYDTMTYKLSSTEMTWRRGVWFKNTGVVPYNRITNIDITQGPVSRSFGIAALKIQTAGYSAPNARTSEIRIEGVEDFEGMRESIMSMVRGRKAIAVETYEEKEDRTVLGELVKIRKLLEKKKK